MNKLKEMLAPKTVPAPEAESGKSPKKLSKFSCSLIIYSAVLLAVCVIGLIVFWNFLASYDKSLPETAVNRYLSEMTREKWYSLVAGDVKYDTNDFESPDALYDKTVTAISEGKISFVKNYDDDMSYFLVRDGKKFAELSLGRGANVGFGMTSHIITSCHILEETVAVTPFAVTVMVPDGASVKLNGIALGDGHITETGAASYQMSKYDAATVGRPTCTIYTVDGFYFMPEAVVTLDGEVLKATENGTLLMFDLPTDRFTSVTITAPSDAAVTVNGIGLDETPTASVPLYSEKYETAESTALTLNTYVINGLVTAPKITCTVAGKNVVPQVTNNETYFAYPTDMLNNAVIYVPHSASVTVNGIALGDDAFKETAVFGGFGGKSYAGYLTAFPQCDVYEIPDLYAIPEVKVSIGDTELAVDADTDDGKCEFVADYPASTDVPTDISDRAQAFTKAFLYYTACGYSGLNENYNYALGFTIWNTDAYNSIKESWIGVYFNDYYTLTYNKFGVTDYTKYTDDLVKISVEFDVDRDAWQYHFNDAGTYDITMIRTGGVWYVVEFSMTTVSK